MPPIGLVGTPERPEIDLGSLNDLPKISNFLDINCCTFTIT